VSEWDETLKPGVTVLHFPASRNKITPLPYPIANIIEELKKKKETKFLPYILATKYYLQGAE
jgi:hypothetical protein